MTKFKVGQKVRCVAGKGNGGHGWELGKVFTIAAITDGFNDSATAVHIGKDGNMIYGDHLELVTKTIENVDYPDIIENGEDKRKVLGRLNDLVFVSISNDFNVAGSERTISELKEFGYKIVQEEEKMITIKGKEYSEDTIHKSLKEYVK